jgi:hypothetical protein
MSLAFWGDTEKNRFESGGELEVVQCQRDSLPRPGDRMPVFFFNASKRTAPVASMVTTVDEQTGSYKVKRAE